jgi:hypothetical protein
MIIILASNIISVSSYHRIITTHLKQHKICPGGASAPRTLRACAWAERHNWPRPRPHLGYRSCSRSRSRSRSGSRPPRHHPRTPLCWPRTVLDLRSSSSCRREASKHHPPPPPPQTASPNLRRRARHHTSTASSASLLRRCAILREGSECMGNKSGERCELVERRTQRSAMLGSNITSMWRRAAAA